jgi:hypothetical protein
VLNEAWSCRLEDLDSDSALTRHCIANKMQQIFARLQQIEAQSEFDWLA